VDTAAVAAVHATKQLIQPCVSGLNKKKPSNAGLFYWGASIAIQGKHYSTILMAPF
jgi:hypothetical protein